MKLRYGKPEEVGVSPERAQRAANLVKRLVDEGISPAIVALAARKGVIFLHEAHGKLNPEPGAPPLPRDAIYPVASISKPLTATALMSLVEEGRVGLHRPVVEYVPEFDGPGKARITIKHLLTHTSGLRDEDGDALAEQRADMQIPPAPDNLHSMTHEWLYPRYEIPARTPPGVEVRYCNFGFTLLGDIIGRVAGKPFQEVCRERVFAPLGMDDTHFIVPEAARARVVRRPEGTPFDFWNDTANMDWPRPAGGGYSSAPDLAAFGQMFLGGGAYGGSRVLSPASVAAMTRNQIGDIRRIGFDDEVYPNCPYGLAWFIFGEDDSPLSGGLWSRQTFGHFGTGGAMMWVDPVCEVVGVFLCAQLEDVWYTDLFADMVTAAIVEV